MRKFLNPGPEDQLGWGVAVSLGLHLLLVAAMMFGHILLPSKREIFSPVYNVQLVGPPGPPAAAPPRAAPPAPKPEPKPEAKPEPKPEPKAEVKPPPKPEPVKEAIATKPPDKPEPKKPEVKKEPEVDASQELAKRLDNLKAKVEEQRRYEQALSRLEKKVATQSNAVGGAFSSAGQGAGGGSNVSTRDQVYLTELWERIQRNWILSEVLVQKPKGLVTVVMLRIRRDGVLEKAWLEQSSGNQRYDDSALRATEKASPFPPPPAAAGAYYEVGVRFRVEDITG